MGGQVGQKHKIAMEQRAWRYAKPYEGGTGKASKKWQHNYAIGTYQGRVKRETRV